MLVLDEAGMASDRDIAFLLDQARWAGTKVVMVGDDLEAQRLIIEMENGRRFWLEQEAVAAKLAHAYATTVHQSQGSTHDIAHVYEDGGGRELAYVAMSRAREATNLYITADDLQQAQEDLCCSWERERRETWAIDTGTPQPGASELEAPVPAALQTLALQAERDALEVAIPTRIDYQLETATYELQAAERALVTVRNERGRYADGELREAAGELFMAGDRSFQHERTAQNKEYSRSIRRDARRQAGADAERVTAAEERLEKLLVAEERTLTGTLDRAKKKVTDLTDEIGDRDRWLGEHPKAPGQLIALTSQVNELRHENDHERWTVEGELNPRPAPAPTIERSWSRSDDRSVGHDRDEGFGL